jgi:hypothetical protein
VPKVWNDDMPAQEPSKPLQPLPWCVAMKRASERLISEEKTGEDDVESMQRAFAALYVERPGKAGETQKARTGDKRLLSLLVSFQDKTTKADMVAEALNANSCAGAMPHRSAQHTMGVFTWFVCEYRPSVMARSPLYLKALWEADHVETEEVLAWEKMGYADMQAYLPEGHAVSEEQFTKLKQAAKPLTTQLVEMSDDEEDDDDDESDDDED